MIRLCHVLFSIVIFVFLFIIGGARIGDVGAGESAAKSIAGAWEGTLKVGDVKISLVINLTEAAAGGWSGTLDAPDSGRKGVPIDDITIKTDRINLTLKDVPASFEGDLNNEWSQMKGVWKQGGQRFNVTFQRIGNVSHVAHKRPQEPQKPYPYSKEEVAFENKTDGARLAATLTLPKGVGPFPAVMLITGSGPQDRDETLFGHRPFLVLADYLTRRGIAVLRADDRGIGRSTGDFTQSTPEDFARDTFAGLEYLKARQEIDRKRIGLIGHSDGGTVASLVASKSTDVAFVVMMAGPGLKGDELAYSQAALMLKVAGASRAQIDKSRELQTQLIAVIQRETDDITAEAELRRVLDAHFASLSAAERKAAGDLGALADAQVKNMLSPSFRFGVTYDPTPTLLKVRCPVLALNGEKDIVVASRENLMAIEAALMAGGNQQFTIRPLPKLNHFFQTCETGSFGECSSIEETLAPVVLEVIGDWIATQMK
ncbi:MAG TPA: alpha/beta fold hydrolase [Pirellulales bacterium]|nr:alpha/beta fold hydrolase [Pirellulales bacterium]